MTRLTFLTPVSPRTIKTRLASTVLPPGPSPAQTADENGAFKKLRRDYHFCAAWSFALAPARDRLGWSPSVIYWRRPENSKRCADVRTVPALVFLVLRRRPPHPASSTSRPGCACLTNVSEKHLLPVNRERFCDHRCCRGPSFLWPLVTSVVTFCIRCNLLNNSEFIAIITL